MKTIKIGCDPEFVIVTPQDTLLMARLICKDRAKKNKFGREYTSFELRPDPTSNIFILIANIRHLLSQIIEKYPILKTCKFVAGHYAKGEPLGGHIHIELDKNDILRDEQFAKLLDKILYLGLARMIDDKNGLRRRKEQEYGDREDIRDENDITIEYRTPPSWLVSPSLAFLYLTLAKICSLIYLNKHTWDINIVQLTESKSSGLALLRQFIKIVEQHDSLMNEKDIQKCIELLKTMPNKLLRPDWNRDFKVNWKL